MNTPASQPSDYVSRSSYVRNVQRLAGRCGARMEGNGRRGATGSYQLVLADDTVICDGNPYGYGLDPEDIETYLREQFPECMPKATLDWSEILTMAAQIVGSYTTGVTLRQLFYQLVARQIIDNNLKRYNYLSRVSAEARRDGTFPDLVDQTCEILVPQWFSSPENAIIDLADDYRRDHTEGQEVSIYLMVEKAGIQNQLWSWFGADLGLPILAVGGYASQTYKDMIKRSVARRGKPAVLIGAVDHDASGDDIWRDLVERTDCWAAMHQIALTKEQVDRLRLPHNMLNEKQDPRQPAFNLRHGYPPNSKVQVELDALPPDVLRGLYQDAIDEYWDTDAYEAVLARESEERDQLRRVKLPKRK